MVSITVETRSGDVRQVEGDAGQSLMELLRENGITDIMALCGGNCSCATCHVHIDSDTLAQLSPMSDDEDMLLDGSDDRADDSRLSCQIPVTADLDGAKIRVAAEQ